MPTTIDPEVCIKCGRCVEACPVRVFEKTDEAVTSAASERCLQCGHCMAICPTEAVLVPGFDYEQFGDLPDVTIDPAAFADFLATRRSTRCFTDEPVDRETLERIVQMAATGPIAVTPMPVEVTVFSTRGQLEALLPDLASAYEQFEKAIQCWPMRFLMRRGMGADQFDAFVEHLGPFMRMLYEAYRRDGSDYLMWGAPAMLLFHADRRSFAPKENCLIACTYAMLAAHSFGLGATMLGIVAPGIENSKELRAKLKIPEHNECIVSLIIGHAGHEFRRTIPREFRSVRWVE